jgi:RNA-directed DNA polymerase
MSLLDQQTLRKGIPIGNLTSQLFANIYLNELDQFVKTKLKIKHYLRYCDDFIILSNHEHALKELAIEIELFIPSELRLKLHEDKVTIRKLSQGIDFLGYVVLPFHTVLRTRTKKRMFRRVNKTNISSYSGLLEHCDSYELRKELISKVN